MLNQGDNIVLDAGGRLPCHTAPKKMPANDTNDTKGAPLPRHRTAYGKREKRGKKTIKSEYGKYTNLDIGNSLLDIGCSEIS